MMYAAERLPCEPVRTGTGRWISKLIERRAEEDLLAKQIVIRETLRYEEKAKLARPIAGSPIVINVKGMEALQDKLRSHVLQGRD